MWRRRIVWTFTVVLAVLVGLGVIGELVGSSTKKSGNSRKVPVSVAAVPGTAARPIPLGSSAAIGVMWRMDVLWRKSNVSQAALGVNGQRLPAGIKNNLVRIKLTYLGAGTGEILPVVDNIEAVGARHELYGADGACNPPSGSDFPDGGVFSIRSGHSIVGTLCFEVAAGDASSLELYGLPPDATPFPPSYPPPKSAVWFLLR